MPSTRTACSSSSLGSSSLETACGCTQSRERPQRDSSWTRVPGMRVCASLCAPLGVDVDESTSVHAIFNRCSAIFQKLLALATRLSFTRIRGCLIKYTTTHQQGEPSAAIALVCSNFHQVWPVGLSNSFKYSQVKSGFFDRIEEFGARCRGNAVGWGLTTPFGVPRGHQDGSLRRSHHRKNRRPAHQLSSR